PGVDFALKTELRTHGGGTFAELGGGEHVAGFVDECAGEVLRVGDDEAAVEAVLHFALGLFIVLARDDADAVDAEVFAVAAVDVDVELGDRGAFDDGAGGEVAGQGVHVLVV